MILPGDSNYQKSLELGHLRGIFLRLPFLDYGTSSPLYLA